MEFKLWLEESGKSKVSSINQALQVLELQHKATEKDIRNAYIKLSKGGHPDLGGSNEQQVLLNAAYLGKFYLPAVNCEAMYNNSIYARTIGKWIEVIPYNEKSLAKK